MYYDMYTGFAGYPDFRCSFVDQEIAIPQSLQGVIKYPLLSEGMSKFLKTIEPTT